MKGQVFICLSSRNPYLFLTHVYVYTVYLFTQGRGEGRELNQREYTDRKEKKIFLIYKKIQNGAVAKSYMRKGFLIYEEMRKYFIIYEEAVSHL